MAGAKTYPPASTTAQWYADTHRGVTMATIDRLTVHTTEGSGWPGYDGGSMAPTWTALPVQTDGTWQLLWRQHFPANMSARALVNALGGVETNTLRDAQVELVGTCVPGGPGVYWPAAPDSLLAGVAGLVAWLHTEWQVPLLTAPLWLPYPSSYGASRARLSGPAWSAFSGVCGHQHVPENAHGDPGNLNIGRILQLASGGTDMPLTDAEIDAIALRTRDKILAVTYGNRPDGKPHTLGNLWGETLTDVAELTAKVDALTAAVHALTSTGTPVTLTAAQVTAIGTAAKTSPDAVVDVLALRLSPKS